MKFFFTKSKITKHDFKSNDFTKVFLLLLVLDSFSTNYKVKLISLTSLIYINDKDKGLSPNKKAKTKIKFFSKIMGS